MLEALRQSLEGARVVVARSADTASFFARFQLAAVVDPCPWGELSPVIRAHVLATGPEASGARHQHVEPARKSQ